MRTSAAYSLISILIAMSLGAVIIAMGLKIQTFVQLVVHKQFQELEFLHKREVLYSLIAADVASSKNNSLKIISAINTTVSGQVPFKIAEKVNKQLIKPGSAIILLSQQQIAYYLAKRERDAKSYTLYRDNLTQPAVGLAEDILDLQAKVIAPAVISVSDKSNEVKATKAKQKILITIKHYTAGVKLGLTVVKDESNRDTENNYYQTFKLTLP